MKTADNPQVDIVLAHYNGSIYIQQQIDSIRENARLAGLAYRLFILDDCSRDDEFESLRKLVRDRKEIHLSRNECNLGVIKTFAKGLSMTSSDYVMLSDQDDVWMKDKIRKSIDLIKKIEDGGPALVFTDLMPVNGDLVPIRRSMLNLLSFDQNEDRFGLLLRNIVAGCTTAVNRKLLDLALPFPNEITMHDHWLALCATFAGKIGFLNEPTVLYRQHGSNVVGSSRSLFARLLQPVHSFRKLNKTLNDKCHQAKSLSVRIKHFRQPGDKELLELIGNSLETRDLRAILFLRKNGALKTFGWSQVALCPAIFLTSFFRRGGAL